MAFSAIAGIGAVASVSASRQAAKATKNASNAAVAQAQSEQAAQSVQADRELAQAEATAAQQRQFEADRAAAEVQHKMGMQNSAATDMTANVQLAAEGDGLAGANKTRQRRAQFRPEYQSGVSI